MDGGVRPQCPIGLEKPVGSGGDNAVGRAVGRSMAEKNTAETSEGRQERPTTGRTATRIDAPHAAIPRAEAAKPPLDAAHTASAAATGPELGLRVDESSDPTAGIRALLHPPLPVALARYRQQAEQLADALRARLRELDRREARDNAQLAQFDQEVRTARLWWGERSAELAEKTEALRQREQFLDEREKELEDRARELGGRASWLEARARELGESLIALNDRASRLAEREARIAETIAAQRSGQ